MDKPMLPIIRYSTILIFLLSHLTVKGQQKLISLQEAIHLARQNSLDFKVDLHRYQSSVWDFRNYKASILPSIYLDGTAPNYGRSVNKITLPDGDFDFVQQNQAFSELQLGIRQNIMATGGTLSLSSSLSRIDIFGDNREIRYSTVPASISYFQDNIGYNRFKWLKKIRPLELKKAERTLLMEMQNIALQTVNLYFSMLEAQLRQNLSRQNLANSDTLLRISRERFKLGSVSKNELLQLRLNVLNAQNELTRDSVNFVLAEQKFSRYIMLPEQKKWQLAVPDSIMFYNIDFNKTLELYQKNGPDIIGFQLDKLNAKQNLDQAKAENGLKFNIRANFGVSNYADEFNSLFNQMESQQNLVLSFSLPLLSWGLAKTNRMRAEANLSMVESQIAQEKVRLEQDIALQVSQWNLFEKQFAVIVESRDIANTNYELELERFRMGTININDLNVAQNQKDLAANRYITALRDYWELFYTIRSYTLFDFSAQENLSVDVSEY